MLSRATLEPTQPPVQWVLGGALSLRHEADHSRPANVDVLMNVSYPFQSAIKAKLMELGAYVGE